MTWLVVARKEFDDARRSRLFWGVVGLLAVATAATTAAAALLPGGATARVGVGVAAEFAGILVPITALVAAYLAVAGERESGSVKLLLGMPPSRRDVVLGKLVGRSVVVAVGVLAGFAVAGLVAVPVYDDLPLGAFAAVAALTVLLGVTFVAVAVGLSAAAATRGRAMTLAVAVYVATTVLWDFLPLGAHVLVEGGLPGGQVPAWYVLLGGLSPTGAYGRAVTAVLAGGDLPGAAGVAGDAPAYLDWRLAFVVLAAWAAVPLVAGYWRFERADL